MRCYVYGIYSGVHILYRGVHRLYRGVHRLYSRGVKQLYRGVHRLYRGVNKVYSGQGERSVSPRAVSRDASVSPRAVSRERSVSLDSGVKQIDSDTGRIQSLEFQSTYRRKRSAGVSNLFTQEATLWQK